MDEDEILTHWALRFDGWRYCRETLWLEADRIAATDRLVNSLEIPSDPLRQLTLFFMLQRFLCKWGGEMLGRRTFDWRAYRTLFLITAGYEVPVHWRATDVNGYEMWDRDFRSGAAEALSAVAFFHATTQYGPMECLGDAESDLDYYHLERYLFEKVQPSFHLKGFLSDFDFFSIVIWKANRAKSRIANRLKQCWPGQSLGEVVTKLSAGLHRAPDSRSRMRLLIEDYKLRLPMASAVLTVLWPDEFSVYDVRVCEELKQFKGLGDVARFDQQWDQYQEYINAVRERIPGTLPLRDKDRVLWSQSARKQLNDDLACDFNRPSSAEPAAAETLGQTHRRGAK